MAAMEWKSRRSPADPTDEVRENPVLLLPRRICNSERGLRKALNAIHYGARVGSNWRVPPQKFPPWLTGCWSYQCVVRPMLFRVRYYIAWMMDQQAGREKPTHQRQRRPGRQALALAARRNCHAAKNAVSCKRHVAVDACEVWRTTDLTRVDL